MITEETMPHADMKLAAKEHLCAVCQGGLTVAWGGKWNVNDFILKCNKDINHTGITRHDKKYEEIKREVLSMDSKALTLMTEGKMLQRVEVARFPQDLTIQDKKLLAQVAITYGFDPLMGEVNIYQGKPFVSIDGRYRKAQETGNLDGVESRPASKQEREDWQIPEGDQFFRADVFVRGTRRPFTGWGRVFKIEMVPGSRKQGDTTSTYKPIQNNPQRMAEKRAEAQALRKAFHIPLPSIEDIGSPDYGIESSQKSELEFELKHGDPALYQIDGVIKPDKPTETTPDATKAKISTTNNESSTIPPDIDLLWAKEQIDTIKENDIGRYWAISNWMEKATGQPLVTWSEAICNLAEDEAEEFIALLQ